MLDRMEKRAQILRGADPDGKIIVRDRDFSYEITYREALERFMEDREFYIQHYAGHITDFLKISPMAICDSWKHEPGSTRGKEKRRKKTTRKVA